MPDFGFSQNGSVVGRLGSFDPRAPSQVFGRRASPNPFGGQPARRPTAPPSGQSPFSPLTQPAPGGGSQPAPWSIPGYYDAGGQEAGATELQHRTFTPESGMTELSRRTVHTDGPSGPFGGGSRRAGDYAAEAIAGDYRNAADARSELRGRIDDLIKQVSGIQGSAGDMERRGLQDADRALAIGAEGRDAIARAGDRGNAVYGELRARADKGERDARRDMQGGVDTARRAVEEQDFFRKDAVAGGVAGVQAQFQQERQRIQSDPSMGPEEKQAALSNLDSSMRRQTQQFAAQADQQASEAALQAKMALGNMQMQMGSSLGGLNAQNTGTLASAGMAGAEMSMRAQEAAQQFMAAQSQWAGGMAQSAMAAAIEARLKGDALQSQLLDMRPFGAPQLIDSIIRMMQVQDLGPSDRMNDGMAALAGQMRRRQAAGA